MPLFNTFGAATGRGYGIGLSGGIAGNSGILTSGSSYTFYSNTGYLRSNLWYARGVGTATNGGGIFTSNTIQAQFIREGI